MRTFYFVLKLVLFLLLLGLAAQNSDPVEVRYFLGQAWQAPLSLVIFVAFALGMVVGLLACGVKLMRKQREVRGLRRQIKAE